MKINLAERRGRGGFSLMEILVVIGLIVLVAAVVISGVGCHEPSSRRKITQAALESIQAALERYHDQFGEYPEPFDTYETVEIPPGTKYSISAAKCLYQALLGDGHDAIKGAENSGKGNPASDGKVTGEEARQVILHDVPQSMWRKVGSSYILVDAFGHPFQYVKAVKDHGNTFNRSSYDLWSYGEDNTNTMETSKDKPYPGRTAKWIKNW